MSVDEPTAIDAFERLGLTSYEAKVFIALQQLGSGTARDIARIADVPRSQVYSVAESLEERGLIEIQQSNPIRYRPVDIDEARELLRDRFETEQTRAFEYLESVREEPTGEEQQEDIWTVRGRERIDDRVVEVLSGAQERIVFAARLPTLVTDEVMRELADRADAGVHVSAVSGVPAVRELLEDVDGVAVNSPTDPHDEDDISGRIVIVDDDSVLLSVVGDDCNETAIWSAGSLFASVLIQLIEANAEAIGE